MPKEIEEVTETPPEETEVDSGEDLSAVVRQVSENLERIQSLLAEEGVSEAVTSRFGKLNEQYKALLQDAMDDADGGGSAEPEMGGEPGGVVDANAGRKGKMLPP